MTLSSEHQMPESAKATSPAEALIGYTDKEIQEFIDLADDVAAKAIFGNELARRLDNQRELYLRDHPETD